TPGTTLAPTDNPVQAFQTLFGFYTGGGGGGGQAAIPDTSILDTDIADIQDIQASLGTVEKAKFDLHLQALRDLQTQRPAAAPPPPGAGTPPASAAAAYNGGLTTDSNFPAILRAQMDVMVNAMACGLTRVGVIQASQHTSELIMSRFQHETPDLYMLN